MIGIGWDVGGWMGSNHGIAVCKWKHNSFHWLGKLKEVSIPKRSLISFNDLITGFEKEIESASKVVIGVDAPLGIPEDFINLQNDKFTFVRPDREIENPLAYRFTDRHIYKVLGKKPLSATFDRLGNNYTVAMVHCKKWCYENSFVIHPFEIQDNYREIIEVYPAIFKTILNDLNLSYQIEFIKSLLPDDLYERSHSYDAALCAIMALCYSMRYTTSKLPTLVEPPENPKIRTEGWIYYLNTLYN
nr:DUF429 domain-containing protein [Natranaerobius trueperi]